MIFKNKYINKPTTSIIIIKKGCRKDKASADSHFMATVLGLRWDMFLIRGEGKKGKKD